MTVAALSDSEERNQQVSRAEALIECGRCREATALLSRLLLTTPNDATLLRPLANAHFKLQELPQALQHIHRAIVLEPVASYGYRLRCLILMAQQDTAALLMPEPQSPSLPITHKMCFLCVRRSSTSTG